ncbi:putative helicase senataxin [Tupaia chinensis]|uniref:Putative helicase senataxin n=1 Tax=Tupaia chinensis TaxID=246437 RepID=L8YC58_TUPCH|nr:putative helicase senataxin [Tupaia chinensis]
MMARFYKLLEEYVEQNTIGRLPILQLTVQYRMHPDICLFPSTYVYNRSLKTNRPAEVDTVDAFQGRQKDCVIVTCVRANATQGSIGFLASLQRLNVTITRAKYSLFILGHLRTLMVTRTWVVSGSSPQLEEPLSTATDPQCSVSLPPLVLMLPRVKENALTQKGGSAVTEERPGLPVKGSVGGVTL